MSKSEFSEPIALRGPDGSIAEEITPLALRFILAALMAPYLTGHMPALEKLLASIRPMLDMSLEERQSYDLAFEVEPEEALLLIELGIAKAYDEWPGPLVYGSGVFYVICSLLFLSKDSPPVGSQENIKALPNLSRLGGLIRAERLAMTTQITATNARLLYIALIRNQPKRKST